MKLNKRVWKTVSVVAEGEGFAVQLDARPLRTPFKTLLVLPTRALAEGVAAEWDAVGEKIDPTHMPLTRAANSATDKLPAQRGDVIAMLAEYGGTDLLCYRAEAPAELVAEQAARWDPWLAWAADTLAAPLECQSGLMPRPQAAASLAALAEALTAYDNFALAGVHDLITISGSLILGLAIAKGALGVDEGFALSRLDADFQARLWGRDDEAEALSAAHLRDFQAAAHLLHLLGRAHG